MIWAMKFKASLQKEPQQAFIVVHLKVLRIKDVISILDNLKMVLDFVGVATGGSDHMVSKRYGIPFIRCTLVVNLAYWGVVGDLFGI